MKNNIKTAALLAGLGGVCMLIGSAWGRGGLMIGLTIGLVMTGGSYWFSDKLAIAAARAQPVTAAQAPEYHAIVARLSERAGIPMPRLFIAPNPQPNAFATGRGPQNAAVCINAGLIDYLTWSEIEGVLAHELSHVKNRDILTQSVAAAVGQSITFLAQMAMWGALLGGGSSHRDREGGGIGSLFLIILGPIAATVIQLAISRSREFEADASAARLIGDGEPLARALEKLESGAQRIPAHVNPSMESAYIISPLRNGEMTTKWFSTHPRTADRVARLRSREWAHS